MELKYCQFLIGHPDRDLNQKSWKFWAIFDVNKNLILFQGSSNSALNRMHYTANFI